MLCFKKRPISLSRYDQFKAVIEQSHTGWCWSNMSTKNTDVCQTQRAQSTAKKHRPWEHTVSMHKHDKLLNTLLANFIDGHVRAGGRTCLPQGIRLYPSTHALVRWWSCFITTNEKSKPWCVSCCYQISTQYARIYSHSFFNLTPSHHFNTTLTHRTVQGNSRAPITVTCVQGEGHVYLRAFV